MDSQDSNLKKRNLELTTQLNKNYQYIHSLPYYNQITGLPNRKKLIEPFNESFKIRKHLSRRVQSDSRGSIKNIGLWVIYEAVRRTKEWHNQGFNFSVVVNVLAI